MGKELFSNVLFVGPANGPALDVIQRSTTTGHHTPMILSSSIVPATIYQLLLF